MLPLHFLTWGAEFMEAVMVVPARLNRCVDGDCRSIVAVTALVSLLAATAVFADNQDACRKRLESEALPAWQELKTSMGSVSGLVTWTGSFRAMEPKDPAFGHDYYAKKIGKFWSTTGAAKVIYDRYDVSGKWLFGKVLCDNPDYSFSQNKIYPGDAYATTDYGTDASTRNQIKFDLGNFTSFSTISFQGWGGPLLPDLIRGGDYQVVASNDTTREGRNLLQVELTYMPQGGAAIYDPSQVHRRLLLDPDADWRVVSDTVTRDKDTTVTEVYYESNKSEFGRVSKVTRVIQQPHRPIQDEDIWEYSAISYQPIAVGDMFYLPGHPRRSGVRDEQPVGVAQQPPDGPTHGSILYLLIIVPLAILYWWSARRRTAGA
jgi:hypothetical protein